MVRIFGKMMRDQVSLPTAPHALPCEPPMLGPVPFAPVLDASIAHTHRWMNGGAPPPSQPLIEVDPSGPAIKRDAMATPSVACGSRRWT